MNAYNSKDLEGFVSCFSPDVLVRDFPNDTLYMGNLKMRDSYGPYMKDNPNDQVKVVKRIHVGSTVIDAEITDNEGKKGRQVAIYEVKNGKIGSMTFIHGRRESMGTVNVAQKQLDAYNARNIDAFLEAYSEEVSVYRFPDTLLYRGKANMRERYSSFFKNTPNLHCTLKARMLVGNTVIDEERVTANASKIHAVAVYEIADGLIQKVTFIREE
ncbi:MAG: nuclear transport factor 2 family protein [Bacteroidota bacterium]